VLLTALAAAIAALIASMSGGLDNAVEDAQQDLQSTGIWGIVILLAIWFVGYYCGGYVAGRMARFDGAKQGVAVWAWAVVIAIVAALIGLVAGQNFALPRGSMPMMPLPEDQAATAAIISAVVVAIVALVGAVLGGLAGMRFHRRVDRAGFEVGADEARR
jgi:MFS family permease